MIAPIDFFFFGNSLIPSLYFILEMHLHGHVDISTVFTHTWSLIPPFTLLIQPPYPVPPSIPFMTILSTILDEIQASLLGLTFLFSFYWSVECRMIPVFITNIHLSIYQACTFWTV